MGLSVSELDHGGQIPGMVGIQAFLHSVIVPEQLQQRHEQEGVKNIAKPIWSQDLEIGEQTSILPGSFLQQEELGTELLQIKGFPYTLEDLIGDPALIAAHRGGRYVTLRLTSAMYHRFHAPHDCRVERVTHIFGDTWNVNPIALRRVEKLFCKNERAILQTRLAATGHAITLVPVAAILVAGIRLNFIDADLRQDDARDGQGRKTFSCGADFKKGDEMGFFQHGSTIIVLAPDGFALCDNVKEGSIIRMGQPLMRLPV